MQKSHSRLQTFSAFLIIIFVVVIILNNQSGKKIMQPIQKTLTKIISPLTSLQTKSINADHAQIVNSASCANQALVYESLRAQLNFLSTNRYSTVGADVIAASTDPLRRTLIINRGESSGVAINNPVIAENGIFVGKIIAVNAEMSTVELLTDTRSKTAATTQNYQKSIGLLEGGFGISIKMTAIPQNEVLNIGDTIITSGLEPNIPYGLVIGTVASLEKQPYQPFQEAVIKPFIDPKDVRLVSVILSNWQ